jgi:hypothetical protein
LAVDVHFFAVKNCDVPAVANLAVLRRELLSMVGTALSPFINLGMQHNGRRAEPWMKKVTTICVIVGGQKGFAREHQHGFYET